MPKYLIIFLFLALNTSAQTLLKGKINEPFANVQILEMKTGIQANDKGEYQITLRGGGTYTILVTAVGFEKISKTFKIKTNEIKELDFQLISQVVELQEVQVDGKSIELQKREEPIKIEVLDLKKVRSQSSSVPQLMNQIAGVKVRQVAGVGSETSININGLQDRSVRFFKDGIPMEYMGRAFNLSLIPVDQIANIEIYKGALPVDLGADALGGGVNIITDRNLDKSLSASFTAGSFSSYQANLNGFYRKKGSNFFTGISSYYVNAANNYSFEGTVLDPISQNLKPATVTRFHDGIKSTFVEGKFGFVDTKLADLIELNVSNFYMNREFQNGLVISKPIGEAYGIEKTNIVSLNYIKTFGRVKLSAFSAYSQTVQTLVDTSSNRYNWLGEIVSRGNTTGEIDGFKSLMTMQNRNVTSRLLATYVINDKNELKASITYTYSNRYGEDPLGERSFLTGEDPLTIPAYYQRNVSGIGLSSKLFKGRLSNMVNIKNYVLNTESSSWWNAKSNQTQVNNFGYGDAIKFDFSNYRFVRFSYERTTRLPDAFEFFGDNNLILPNPDLIPERSQNLNLAFTTNLDKAKKLSFEVNLFYRFTENFIQQRAIGIFFSNFENTDDAKIKGIESSLKWKLPRNFTMNAAVTLQDLRRVNTENAGKALEGARLPNIPYFYTNVNLKKDFEQFTKNCKASIYANYAFTEKYLLYPIPVSFEPELFQNNITVTDQIIPTQHQVDVGFTLLPQNIPFSFNVEAINLTDEKLFDTFRVQRPGRFLRLKINYKL